MDIGLAVSITDAEIRYTLDGTEPDETSTLYTGPIPRNTPLTLKTRAWREGWTPSGTLTAEYTFNGEPVVWQDLVGVTATGSTV
ncbi:MAG: chitobiase/beta-hexosaminidase C-terminal domain-containing protein, partial [Vicinamibacteria bacterium]|nr:chitobiase/beta-hexosaminidase C-terminal domain-containing protein [Vicinamibacteria bacterium]